MKSLVSNLIDKIVYYYEANGECYSGVLEPESSMKKSRYVVKRAIPMNSSSHKNAKTILIDESKISKVDGPHIYLKQETIKPVVVLNVKELTNAPF